MARSQRAHLVRVFPPAPHGGVVVTPFEGSRMTCGRDPDCSIQTDATDEPRHARIERPRTGTALRVQALNSTATWVNGRLVPKRGADLPAGGILRIGGAVFVHRHWTEDAAKIASWSPLPGPVNSCHPTVVDGLRRLQSKRNDAGTFWICGSPGAGRSVVIDHLRALVEVSSGGDWITGGAAFEAMDTPPADADPARTLILPPLRERPEDILVLLTALTGGVLPLLSPRLVEALVLYDWPGNIRELRLAIARAHDPRFSPGPDAVWGPEVFPDCARRLDELAGAADPLTLQTPTRALPRSSREMRDFMDGHDWRTYHAAAASGHTRGALLDQIFALGIREPWEPPEEDMSDVPVIS